MDDFFRAMSPEDRLRLAEIFMQDPLFRRIVQEEAARRGLAELNPQVESVPLGTLS